ncbi:MAG: GMC oxidoreductase [Silvanigrellaceae bacterium]
MNFVSTQSKEDAFDFDFVIVGSGFGGSVSALRLSEKGYRVCVIEQGKRFRPQDYAKSNWDLQRYLWAPFIKCFGIQRLTFFRDVLILSGSGVGGGSLVYANTLMMPSDKSFESPSWKPLGNARDVLAPFYVLAKKMLGAAQNPKLTFIDHHIEEYAKINGLQSSFSPTEVAVFFGEPGRKVPDPYFNGDGPERTGCNFCGGCMVGCRFDAKNTLDKNYLWLAEKRGAEVRPLTKITKLRPLDNDGDAGWELSLQQVDKLLFPKRSVLRARNVVLAGGVLGTLRLLLENRDKFKTLTRLSPQLGHHVRTNSEVFTGSTELNSTRTLPYSHGIAISSIFKVDSNTAVEPVRYPVGSNFMRLLAAPLVSDPSELRRSIKFIWRIVSQPIEFLRFTFNARWAEQSVIFLVMQDLDNRIRVRFGRSPFTLFTSGLVSEREEGSDKVPSEIPSANQFTEWFSKKVGGQAQCAVTQVTVNIPTTAHILGGCPIGETIEDGVIDSQHRLFGYKGVWVCDGSAVPANLGVNPSLTITAMTERAMTFIPSKPV